MRQIIEFRSGVARFKVAATEYAALNIFLPRVPNMIKDVSIQYPPGFWKEYEIALRAGLTPTVVSSHSSWGDAIPAFALCTQMYERARNLRGLESPPGYFLTIVADSLLTGAQDPTLKKMTDGVMEEVERAHMKVVGTVREKDRILYPEVYAGRSNKPLFRTIREVYKERAGFFLLAEGSVQGGRRRTDGQPGVWGMVEPEEPFLDQLIIGASRELWVVPVGTSGGYNIINSDTKLPTARAFMSAVGVPGIKLARMVVGPPETSSKIRKIAPGDLSDPRRMERYILGCMVAPLLPYEEQGIYRGVRMRHTRGG